MRCEASGCIVAALSLAAALLGGCRDRPLSTPQGPDLTQLVAAYDAPGGVLNQGVLIDAIGYYLEHRDELEELGIDSELILAVKRTFEADVDTGKASGELGVRREGLSVVSDGFLVIRRVCRGWDDEGVDARVNGELDLTATFTADGPDPVVWGGARQCRYRFGGRRVLLDAASDAEEPAIRLHLGDDIGFGDVGKKPVLFSLDLRASLDDFSIPVQIDFRVTGTSLLEVRVPAAVIPGAGGDVVLEYAGGALIGARAKNGHFNCDPLALKCVSDDGAPLGS